MKALELALKKQPVVYITRDLERALGLPLTTKNYFIITNATPFGKQLAKSHRNILLITSKELLDTRELLANSKTKQFLSKLKRPAIVVFKNTVAIERYCQEQGWQLLNPSATLASQVEEKISQVEWLGGLTKFLPRHQVEVCKNVKGFLRSRELGRNDSKLTTPFIIQFNRAHTGSGTILITSKKQLAELQRTFPDRPVRVSEYISGPLFTNNNSVWGKRVLVGNINYQITGLPPFTERPFATIGNDWALPTKLLSSKQINEFKQMATAIGKKLSKDGWKGLFGVDVVLDEISGKLYLIEINARQPASTTYESELQRKEQGTKNKQKYQVSSFEANLAALLGLPYDKEELVQIRDGAQGVQKLTKEQGARSKEQVKKIINTLRKNNFTVIPYQNSELESDQLRIQSKQGLIEKHLIFNKHGKFISDILT